MEHPFLEAPSIQFPSTDQALKDPNGLLVIGGDLSPEFLLTAYSQGIFPWFEEGQDVHWWTPSPRMVLYPNEVHCSKSLKKHIKKIEWKVKVNSRFEEVIDACADTRLDNAEGTWITHDMRAAYIELHQQGFAHSIEVYNGEELIGGLYGLGLGQIFFGESMFSYRTNASKMAFLFMARWLRKRGFPFIDCQVSNPHLVSLGAREIYRADFEQTLREAITSELVTSSKSHWLNATNKVLSVDGHIID